MCLDVHMYFLIGSNASVCHYLSMHVIDNFDHIFKCQQGGYCPFLSSGPLLKKYNLKLAITWIPIRA